MDLFEARSKLVLNDVEVGIDLALRRLIHDLVGTREHGIKFGVALHFAQIFLIFLIIKQLFVIKSLERSYIS